MTSPLSDDERNELYGRAQKLHRLYNLGGAYPVGEYTIDWVQNAGLWVYKNGEQIYGDSLANPHADHADSAAIREVLDALRRQMILEDLADV